ncbi:tripartite tricarboxylate transporter substrate binding protein [Roseomonas terrae]|jgi:tripartite-type tricarboxylate transporter receptor subunit TctC|uniref:Tripartite tricarboxylate transporter substrate binding protein n=1 Tax=Neoroseomonas terrae TaxID=424799 RepID=A0ABS5EDH2_9PROT|nr:tripartite tricarboxylate transporter substrate binding protein [Neoroseomonas terrae]MBR0648777.1 tripartite tricarboxylate transporter substrate binding protein [Neoroseomonas terrae]
MQRRSLLAGLAGSSLARPALSQAWTPTRPVRLVLGFPPGGASDAAVRILQPVLQASLGQPVVIDNRPGAGGNLGALEVARAAPDGSTIGSANMGTLAVNPALVRNMGFDPATDLLPVSMLFNAVNVLVVPANRPFRSVADIVAAAKARPETISYGTGGVGSPGHLCGILFDHIAGTKTVPVPYRGGGPQMLALVAGEHDFGFSPMGTVLTHVQAGTIRALGVATRTRATTDLPSVPTMIEAGLPDFEVLNWDGIVVPRGTPAPIRARLAEVVRAALVDPALAAGFRQRGLDAWPTTPEGMAAQLAADAAKWQPLIRAAGIEPS